MAEKISQEELRALWEKAQAHRRKRALRAKRKGNCTTCHVNPRRSARQNTCLQCHAAYRRQATARESAARKARQAEVAAAAAARKREARAAKKAGENRAYLDFLFPS